MSKAKTSRSNIVGQRAGGSADHVGGRSGQSTVALIAALGGMRSALAAKAATGQFRYCLSLAPIPADELGLIPDDLLNEAEFVQCDPPG